MRMLKKKSSRARRVRKFSEDSNLANTLFNRIKYGGLETLKTPEDVQKQGEVQKDIKMPDITKKVKERGKTGYPNLYGYFMGESKRNKSLGEASKFYVGFYKDRKKKPVVFEADKTPTEDEYPEYGFVTGPFKSREEAEVYRKKMINV